MRRPGSRGSVLQLPGRPRVQLPQSDERSRRGEPRSYFYERLARVVVEHGYYATTGGRGPLFTYQPTGYCAHLMRDLNLLFRQEEDGFSVLYETKRERQLFDYLRREARVTPDGRQSWTRLSFRLLPVTPYLVNFTQLPVATNPTQVNVYLDNREAHREDGTVWLQPGERVTAADLMQVVPPQLEVHLGHDFKAVEVRTLSGEVVICMPRCVAPEVARRKRPDQYDCDDPTLDDCDNESVYLDLSRLPQDRYSVVRVPELPWSPPWNVLYTAESPVPFGFLDLLFAAPGGTGGGTPDTGVYPVQDLFDSESTSIQEVEYRVAFEARRTVWVYRVQERPGQVLADLEIRGPVPFLGPVCVVGPEGRYFLFVALEELSLHQRSDLRFELWGRTGAASHRQPLRSPLPLPSPEQVLPRRQLPDGGRLLSLQCPGASEPERAAAAALGELLDRLPPDVVFSRVFVYV